MKRWVVVGGAVMMAAWVPFLYAEWTSRPAAPRSVSAMADSPEPVSAGAPAPALGTKSPASAPAPAPATDVKAAPQPEAMAHVEHHAEAVSAAVHPPSDAGVQGASGSEHLAAQEGAAVEAPTPAGPLDALKHAYETQPRDPLWASDTEARVKGYFGANQLPPDMLHAASCRRAVCRVEIRWSSDRASAFVTLNQRLAQDFGPEIALAPIAPAEGEDVRQVDLYLMRKGFTVADLAK